VGQEALWHRVIAADTMSAHLRRAL